MINSNNNEAGLVELGSSSVPNYSSISIDVLSREIRYCSLLIAAASS